jgi:hypothetical protein
MRSKVYLFSFSIALVIILSITSPVWAQRAGQGLGNINGTVSDETGAVVPGADVTVLNTATSSQKETVTDDLGFYTVQGLNIQGRYDVSAALSGFKTAVVSGQRVSSDTTLTVNIVLAVGQVTETVTVSGQASLIKTTDTTVAHQQDAEMLEVLPVQMNFFIRQSMTLINTLPGVIFRPTWDGNKGTIHGVGDEGPQRNPIGYNTDGHQSSINWHQGLRDETGPAPELIQEFRIETNQDAEKGFNSGVSVEMITKSGTNDFHGSLFWFHRNDWLDARPWTASSRGRQKQNEAGFVLGGPILKDKAWFMMNFSSFEWKNFSSGRIGTVQTDLMRGGNFTEILGDVIGTDPLGREVRTGMIYDPLTTREVGGQFVRDPFAGNIVPDNRIGSVARHLMTAYPGPNIPGAGLSNNYDGTGGEFFDTDKTYLKTDIEHNQHKFTIGYEDTPNNKLTFASPANRLQTVAAETRGMRLRLNHLWTLSPSLLLSTRAGINRITYGEIKQPPSNNHCPGGCVQGALTDAIPRISIQSAVGGGFGDNTDSASHFQSTVPIFMDVSWIKGNHSMKFGAQLSIWAGRFLVENHTAGSYTFRNRITGFPAFTGCTYCASTGDGFASFLMGDVDAANQSTSSARKITSYSWAFYAQDSWRASNKLTVNYGLRWEMPIGPHESYDRIGIMDPSVPNPAAGGILGGLTFYGEGPGRNGQTRFFETGYKSFGPRLGLAYQMDDKTVLRAYYGLMFRPINGELGNYASMPQQGFGADVAVQTTDGGLTPAFNWENGINILPTDLPSTDPSLINGSAVGFVDRNDSSQGTAQRLGLAFEHELPWEMVGRAEYIGLLSHGIITSQIARYNQNPLSTLALGDLMLKDINSQAAIDAGFTAPYAGFEGTVGQAIRPFPQYDWVAQFNSHSGYNLYHSGIFMLQKRFSDGLNFMLSHTVAKSLTAGDDRARLGFGLRGGTRLQHWNLLGVSKTIVPFNRSWATKASFSWQLPFGRGKRYAGGINSWANQAVGGWRLAGSLVYHAGNNLTVDSGQLNPYMGPQWANSVSGVPVSTGISCGDLDRNVPGQDRIFNGAAYEFAPAFSFGNSRVHPSAQQCGFAREDLALIKDFIVNEDVNVRLGAEFQNAFNRTNWRDAGTTVNSSGFGQVNNVLAARVIQLYLKINF